MIHIAFTSFSRGAGRPGIVDLAGLAGAAPGESDFILGWPEGMIEVIQIASQSLSRGTGRPGIVDSAGLAAASLGREWLYFGVASGRDRSDSSHLQIIFPLSGPAGDHRICRSGVG